MELLPQKSWASRITRTIIWVILAVAFTKIAKINHEPLKNQRAMKTMPELQAKFRQAWMFETGDIDSLNLDAAALVAQKHLKPGDPLPPSWFFDKTHPLRSALNKETNIQIVRTSNITTKFLSAQTEITIVVGDHVPPPGFPYAAVCLLTTPEVTPNGMLIYPDTPKSLEWLRIGMRILEEKKKKLESPTKPHQ